MRLEHRIHIDAPPAAVWSVLKDIERWPDWTPSITFARIRCEGPLEPGLQADLITRGAGPATWSVTEAKPGASFAWEASVRGIHVLADHVLTPVAGGTDVLLSVDVSGLPLMLFKRMVRRQSLENLQAEAAGLKFAAEQATSVPVPAGVA